MTDDVMVHLARATKAKAQANRRMAATQMSGIAGDEQTRLVQESLQACIRALYARPRTFTVDSQPVEPDRSAQASK